MSRRSTQAQRQAEAAAVNAEWLEEVGPSNRTYRIRCLACGHEWAGHVTSVQQKRGCKRCGTQRQAKKARVPQSERDRQAAAMGLDWLAPCTNGDKPTPIRCLVCRHEWKATPWNVSQEHGCPACADRGFDGGAPSEVYLLRDARKAVKVGITNKTRKGMSRVEQHSRNGWNLVESWDTETGSQAREVEREILRWWRKDLGLPPAYKGRDGDTETVDTRKIGLDEIKARIEQLIDDL